MPTSRTSIVSRTAVATAVGLGTLRVGAAVAGAESPPPILIVQGETDPQPDPFPGATDLADLPLDPGPDPMPEDLPELAAPDDDPEPEPEPIDDLAQAEPGDDPGPGDGPDDEGIDPGDDDPDPDPIDDLAEPGCHATHGCEPGDCHPLQTSCDLTDREPGDDPGGDPEDTPEDTPEDEEPEVLDSSTPSGRLPHTGGGIALLTMLGGALAGLGVAVRRLAGRA